jgi:N12 class adenine-specific DNA methylase
MTKTFGTSHIDAVDLLNAVCNSKAVVVERPKEDIELRGGPKIDAKATFAAQAKAAKISEEFGRWVFADDTRREAQVAEFNRRFNSLRAPRHNGDKLQPPGLSSRFEPHPYQRDAVARIIAEPTVLLDHVVGAGKTGSMFMGAMELRRLGLVKQPWMNTVGSQT